MRFSLIQEEFFPNGVGDAGKRESPNGVLSIRALMLW